MENTGRSRRRQGNRADQQPAGRWQGQRFQRLIRKPQPLISREALELPFSVDGPTNKNDAGRTLGILLQQRQVQTALTEQLDKGVPYGVLPETAREGGRAAQARQGAGHIRRGSAEPIVHRPIQRRITTGGTQTINQGFTQADHRCVASGHPSCLQLRSS